MSSLTVTHTTITCDIGKVQPGRSCGMNPFRLEGKSNATRAAAKRWGWVHRHWCGTKVDLCPWHASAELPDCESKGGRPRK